MITNYTDRRVIQRGLDQLLDATEDVKDLGLAAAAKLDDLGITVTETQAECLEVRDKIPDHLLFQAAVVDGYGVFVHGRIEELPATV